MTTAELARAWLTAKAEEAKAAANRQSIEAQIINVLGAKQEGSQTHDVEGFKVTITGKLSYKADVPQLIALCDKVPENLRPLKTETKLDETGAKYLRANEPGTWALIAPAITVTPAKTALSIKEA
ncbi:hypothetical protein [Bordetella bronchialis]|uniref:Uncharacterized protein n=1 Tax=Bordetella bronchialis TaxID=463025 RepID=A0A193FV62_9BORD|nr:hypothetical protein [Bordetella bronchialis]ANN66448.1 hypothetical protein BAU06_09210 [Bordetella bronchialis]ANN71525.1 hypothetical protein BAU08_09420 [Bordetella bronchialis]